MRKRTWLFPLLCLLLLLLAACGTSESTQGDTSQGTETETAEENTDAQDEGEATSDSKETYVVATDNGYVPFEYLDPDTGELIGFDIDLIHALAEEAGINIEIETMEFDGVVAGISSGRFDIGIAGMTITEERKENIDFSQPYYDAGLVLAVHVDNEEIQSIDDLAGKTVTTRVGSTSETFITNETEGIPEAFPQITEAYQNVITGRSDATLYDLPNVQYYASTEGGGQLKIVGDRLTGEQYGIAFPKGSPLRDKIDAALTELMENGTYGDIYEKWFDERPEGM
ncbi:transporter substrate-binding domain-containing protein [Alkalihalobacillus sp. LMS39]|uniref:transporter substrate-binding domain-containing protein n=1 Tax=Alkalihalobacillus sp. LMS39 TaxID=2924032 RepID=UPI001FB3B616|nr:transporter substrate-binding domain-containing protein [Alkalihalobacillus sp. LMS39]UOE94619.1 transporter substrate-binding domain-containing protein [Alkalihalobacillus sp. LMS39]